MDIITQKAYAKINLGLDVIRRREDGYHEVKMVMQNIGIHDVLTFRKQDQGISLKIDRAEIPTNEENLVYRTAKLIMDEYRVTQGVEITLKKHIPVAAGLAGGSADAAATFRGMNELFDLNMTEEKMKELGIKIGADVPYCIMGGTVLAEGIGEQLTPLPAAPKATVLIAKPDISVSTKYVYQNLKVDEIRFHPDIDGMVKAISHRELAGVTELLGNVLENVTAVEYPVIDQIKAFMMDNGAYNALMSGSGPAVFGIFASQEAAADAFLQLKKSGTAKELYVTTFIDPKKEEKSVD